MPRFEQEPKTARHHDDKVLGAFGVATGIVILIAIVVITLNDLLY